MQSSLGIYVTDKLIKYAKIQKDNNNLKILSNGIKFYDNLEMEATIKKIIEETDSANIPIGVNADETKYYFFELFNLANKSYVDKAIETEFESFCGENKLNKSAYEYKFSFAKSIENPDKNKIVLLYNSINSLQEKYNSFKGTKLNVAMPTSCALPNICNLNSTQNALIVNLEEKTTITTIINKSLYSVDIINEGLKEPFEQINEKENDYLKTYDVFKNTTIYTADILTETEQSNEYLSLIIPSLYKIIQEVKNVAQRYNKIEKIYLTGMGTVINNVDLYFQESFKDAKVEILKPFFLNENETVNIKDYIEVNSAIAIAMQSLGYGIESLNFKKDDKLGKLKQLLSMDIASALNTKKAKMKTEVGQKKQFNFKDFTSNFGQKMNELGESIKANKVGSSIYSVLDKIETTLISDCIVILLIIVFFSVVMIYLRNETNSKIAEAESMIQDTKQQISLVQDDDTKVNSKTVDYQRYKTNLQNASSAVELKRSRKNQITTLLNNLVYNIPKEVVLTKIKNTETQDGSTTVQHITISAQSKKYEQLAYFKAKLKNENILQNINSSEGTKEGDYVKIVIEGDLRNY